MTFSPHWVWFFFTTLSLAVLLHCVWFLFTILSVILLHHIEYGCFTTVNLCLSKADSSFCFGVGVDVIVILDNNKIPMSYSCFASPYFESDSSSSHRVWLLHHIEYDSSSSRWVKTVIFFTLQGVPPQTPVAVELAGVSNKDDNDKYLCNSLSHESTFCLTCWLVCTCF